MSTPEHPSFLSRHGAALSLGLVTVVAAALVIVKVREVSEQVTGIARDTEALSRQIAELRAEVADRAAAPADDDARYDDTGEVSRTPENGEANGEQWDECTGQVDPDVVTRMMQESSREFRACYERRLAENPDLSPLVTVEARVDAEGRITAARVGAPDQDESFFDCLLQLAVRLEFSSPAGGECAVVRLPFDFSSSEGVASPEE